MSEFYAFLLSAFFVFIGVLVGIMVLKMIFRFFFPSRESYGYEREKLKYDDLPIAYGREEYDVPTVREVEFQFRNELTDAMSKANNFDQNKNVVQHYGGETREMLQDRIEHMVNTHREKYGYVDYDVNRMPPKYNFSDSDDPDLGEKVNPRDAKGWYYPNQEEYNKTWDLE